VSYINTVTRWVEDSRARLALAQEGTAYFRECQKILQMNEALLADLQKVHEPKQRTFLREPGDET
jgi:DNA-binding transcriptional LysR family regulator